MNTDPSECPKCKGDMEEGFILDVTHGHRLASHWVAGAPEKSFWLGVKVKGKRLMNVRTFRCKSCGYLESYSS